MYLAIPAVLVVKPVTQTYGLSWAISILLMTLVVLSAGGKSRPGRIAVQLLVTIFVIVNTALAVSFIMQGTSFNDAFLAHLDLSTLKIALKTDALRFSAAVLYILAAPFVASAVINQDNLLAGMVIRKTPALFKAVLLVLSVILSYPLQSIVLYAYTTSQSSERLLSEIENLNLRIPQSGISVESPKNLVLIYLEGIEQNYHDPEIFPELMPILTAQRREALWFSNVQQFPGTGWTISGIVSSQCGVPLLSKVHGNRILTAFNNPFRQVTCLAEYLKGAGYQNIFLGGASLDFAGKGKFLLNNGYDAALGIDELPTSARHSWGMYDADMFGHAKKLFDGLAAGESPFLLTLLTLDTHHPFGTPSPGCTPYAKNADTMLNAVHCTDQLVQDFLSHVHESDIAEDTIIALVSDHLLIMGDVEASLEAKSRRITFVVLDPSRQAQQMDEPATHFDIGPTLLELVGITNAEFAFGHSLISNGPGKAFTKELTKSDFERFKIENLTERVVLREGIVFFPATNSVKIGRARFETHDGHEHSRTTTTLLGMRKNQFLAMYFSSIDNNYPELYWTGDDLLKAIEDKDSGLVVAASEGTRLCLGTNKCQEKRFLLMYDLASQKMVVDNDGVELSLSRMDTEAVSSSQ
jgi:hypothetical protein